MNIVGDGLPDVPVRLFFPGGTESLLYLEYNKASPQGEGINYSTAKPQFTKHPTITKHPTFLHTKRTNRS